MMVNNTGRAVPTNAGWVDDGKDVNALLGVHLEMVERYRLPTEVAPQQLAEFSALSWWRLK